MDSAKELPEIGIVEPVDSFLSHSGLCVTAVVVSLTEGDRRVKIACTNITDNPVILKDGVTVATIQLIEKILPATDDSVQQPDEQIVMEDQSRDLATRTSQGLAQHDTKCIGCWFINNFISN